VEKMTEEARMFFNGTADRAWTEEEFPKVSYL
jgi:hypothetical protein